MSLWPHSRAALGISATAVALVVSNRAGEIECLEERYHPTEAPSHTNNVAQDVVKAVSALFESPLFRRAPKSTRVVLSDDLAKYNVLTPPSGIKSLAELNTVATSRFEEIYDTSAAKWLISADWHSSGRFLCCALPRYADTIRQALADRARNSTLGSVLSTLLPNISQALPGRCWLCTIAEGYFSLALIVDSRVISMRAVSFHGSSLDQYLAEAAAELQREQNRLPIQEESPAFMVLSPHWLGDDPSSHSAAGRTFNRIELRNDATSMRSRLPASDACFAAWIGAL